MAPHGGRLEQTNQILYVDGQLGASQVSSNIVNTTYENQIGTYCDDTTSTGYSEFTTGTIDEVAVFNYVLTQADVTALYESGASTKCTGR